MRVIAFILVLCFSILGNLILLHQHIELKKENEKLRIPYVYQKAQKDIEVFFDSVEGKNKTSSHSTNVENEKKDSVLINSDSTSDITLKNTYISFGVFSTDFFIKQNVKILLDKNIVFTLKKIKNRTQILIGPLSNEEAVSLIKQSFMPKDSKLIYEK